MGGVELAPPADGLRWGRRCRRGRVRARRAAAPDRRHRGADAAAHDHVARDPPDRARALRLDRRGRATIAGDAGTRRDLERVGRERSAGDPRRRAAGARRATSTRSARRRTDRGTDGRDGRVVRVERLPRPHLASRGDRRRARGARPLGHRRGLGPAHRRLPPVHSELEHELADVEGNRAQPRSSPPASPRTSACSRRSARPACSCAPTSSTTRRSSTAAGSRAPTRPCTATATSTTSARCCATAAAGARSW